MKFLTSTRKKLLDIILCSIEQQPKFSRFVRTVLFETCLCSYQGLTGFAKYGFCEIAKSGFCEMRKIWMLRNEKSLDFAKPTFLTTFIKLDFVTDITEVDSFLRKSNGQIKIVFSTWRQNHCGLEQ